MGISFSSRALITPKCAAPFAPPPLSTRPTVCSCAALCTGVSAASISRAACMSFFILHIYIIGMQRPRGGPVWIERAIDHSPLLVNLFSGEPVCANIQPYFFLGSAGTLRVQPLFISRSAKPSGFSPTLFQVTQNPQGPALLYFKERKTLRVQPYFISRSTKPSGASPTLFQEAQNPQGSALLFFKEHKTLRVQPLFFSSDTKPSGASLISFIGETQLPGHSLHRVRSGVSHTSIG